MDVHLGCAISGLIQVFSMCTSIGKEDCKRNILGPANPQAPEQGWGTYSMDEVHLEPPTEGSPQGFTSFSWTSVPKRQQILAGFCINSEISKYWQCNKYTNSYFFSGWHWWVLAKTVTAQWCAGMILKTRKRRSGQKKEWMDVDKSLPRSSIQK